MYRARMEEWLAVDAYLAGELVDADPVLDAALEASAAGGLPPHEVAPNQGKLLMLLAQLTEAERILEIGTLGGYSTIWLARALPASGRLITLESDASYARVAVENVARAGLDDRVDVRVGPALDTLEALEAERAGPFDLVFIDADKPNNPRYLEWALRLARPGTLIVGDNVVRDGAVVDPESDDQRVIGVRTFIEMIASDPRLDGTGLQTVGSKGWDGFVLARVVS